MEDILAGRYFLEERMMLHSELCYEDGLVQSLPDALNDIVIGHGNVGKLIRIDLSINGHFIQQYPGDGLIVATADGEYGLYLLQRRPYRRAQRALHHGHAHLPALAAQSTPGPAR